MKRNIFYFVYIKSPADACHKSFVRRTVIIFRDLPFKSLLTTFDTSCDSFSLDDEQEIQRRKKKRMYGCHVCCDDQFFQIKSPDPKLQFSHQESLKSGDVFVE